MLREEGGHIVDVAVNRYPAVGGGAMTTEFLVGNELRHVHGAEGSREAARVEL